MDGVSFDHIRYTADEYRRLHRLDYDDPLEVHIPGWYAARLVDRYGSLDAAANEIFNPGSVKIVDDYWGGYAVRAQEDVDERIANTWPKWRSSDLNDLTRIACAA